MSRWFAILAFAAAILVFVGLSSSTALAASIPPDPGVRLTCPGCGSTELTSPTFFFEVFGGSVNTFDFINSVGQTAVELDLTEVTGVGGTPVTPFDLQFQCDPANVFFNNCTPQTLTATNEVRFFGLDDSHGGILNAPADTITCIEGDCSTTVTLADFGIAVDATGLAVNHNFFFEGSLVVTPEPSTVLLLLVGVGFLFLFRRAGWVPKLT
jgi:hypothetical protein